MVGSEASPIAVLQRVPFVLGTNEVCEAPAPQFTCIIHSKVQQSSVPILGQSIILL